MFKLVAFVLVALAALSTVSGAPIFPRQNVPSGWDSNSLESYQGYNTRFLALGCQNQQNTQFFDDCCHPLKQGQTLEKSCSNPSSISGPPSNTLMSEPPSSEPISARDDEDCEDDDDGDYNDDEEEDCEHDHPSSSPTYQPSFTPTPASTHDNLPQPTSPPTSSPEPSPSPSSSTDDSTPTSTPDQSTPTNSETHTGGSLTYFYQNGVAGACGTVHSDGDFIAALDSRTYGDSGSQSSYCGKKIRITWQDKSVDVVVADDCPTCANASSVDLSVAAFQALAPLSVGELDGASWTVL